MRYFKQFEETLGGKRAPPAERRRPPGLHSRGRGLSLQAELPLQCRGRGLQGAAGALFHDGRQPRQFARLALLGLRARPQHRRQGLLHLDEFRQPQAHRLVRIRSVIAARGRHEAAVQVTAARHFVHRPAVRGGRAGLRRRAGRAGRSRRCSNTRRSLKAVEQGQGRQHRARGPRRSSTGPRRSTTSSPITGKDLDVTKDGDKVVVSFAYDKEIHLFGPAFLLLKYAGQSELTASASGGRRARGAAGAPAAPLSRTRGCWRGR